MRSSGGGCIIIIVIVSFYVLGVYLARILPAPYNMIAFYTSAIGGPIATLGLVIVYAIFIRKKQKEDEKQIKYFICPECNTSVDKKKEICPKCGKNLFYGSDIVAK